MRFESVMKWAAAAALGLGLAACGGGGGGSPETPAASLQLTGFAASGRALDGASITVKCANGTTGSAQADGVGRYTANIQGAALPCMLRAAWARPGVIPMTVLHSFADAGATGTDGVTRVTAQITPATELVAAQIAKALPATWFEDFSAARSSQVTTARLQEATAVILAALRDGAGIDFGAIDPFKSELIPDTGSNTPNAHDKLLDRIVLNRDGLDQLIYRMLGAATAAELQDAMLGASGGTLRNCPVALSGKYRSLDYTGRMVLRTIDFAQGTLSADGGGTLAITAPTDYSCTFTATGTENGETVIYEVAMGKGGAGSYRTRATAPVATAGEVGYLFPVQMHVLSDLTGTNWRFIQSGYDSNVVGAEHFVGGLAIGADRSVNGCQVALSNWSCHTGGASTITISDRSDGGFDLLDGGGAVLQFYAYRPYGGDLVLFGSSNPSGSDAANVVRMHLVGFGLKPLAIPAPETLTGTHEMTQTDLAGVGASTATSSSVRIRLADTATGEVSRQRLSDNRVETVLYNNPVDGVRQRVAAAGQQALTHVPLAQLGLTVEINTEAPPVGSHIYNIVVNDK